MLCLTRRIEESIFVGDSEVKVLALGHGRVRLGITAGNEVSIDRAEVRNRKRGITQNIPAASLPPEQRAK